MIRLSTLSYSTHLLSQTFALSNYQFSPSTFSKVLGECQQATALDLAFYDNFAPQKLPLLKIFDDVIAGELWFGPHPIKNLGYANAMNTIFYEVNLG